MEKLYTKLKNKLQRKKIIFIIILLISGIIVSVNSYNRITKINNETKIKSERSYEGIQKKIELITLILHEFKSGDKFVNYTANKVSDKDFMYSRAQLFRELKMKNIIYGRLGFYISVADSKYNSFLTHFGTIEKETFYRQLDFPFDIEKKDYYINDFLGNINIYFKDTSSFDNPMTYILTLDKEKFFYELMPESKRWYIFTKDHLINFGNLKDRKFLKIKEDIQKIYDKNRGYESLLDKVAGKKAYIFYDSFLDFTIFYLQEGINIPIIVLHEISKVILLLGIICGIVFTARLFVVKPLRQLAEDMGYIKSKDGKELEYIEHKIEEIKNMNQTLQDKVISMRNYQKKKKIKDYLLGISTSNEVLLMKKEFEIFKVSSYRVMIMEIYDLDSVENIFDKFNLSKELIMKYFSEEVICEVVDLDYKSIAFIMEELIPKEDLEEILKCLVSHIERNFNLKFTVVATNSYDNIAEMPKAYRTAKRILDYKYIFKQERVIFQDKINDNNFNKYYYPIELESKLILRALSSNEISVKRIIDEMFNEKNNSSMDKNYIKEFGMLLYNTLNRIFIQLKEIDETVDVKNYKIEDVLNVNDAAELKEKFQEKIFEICNLTKIEIEEEKDVHGLRLKIERFIEDNYMIDVSLENLADYLGHSLKYTSILFKKVMGDNFKNYLSLYRIEKAKKIVSENHNLKIKEIAELIGYNSSNTFIRIFKKYEGISPGKYFGIFE